MLENLSEKLSKSLKVLQGKHKLSQKNITNAIREVRRALLEADVALEVVRLFIANIEKKALGLVIGDGLTPTQSFIKLVQQELIAILKSGDEELNLRTQSPAIIMVAGLQGAGKTTTVAKLANHLKNRNNKKVLLVSTDVYRPAAITQLQVLAEQLEIDCANDNDTNPISIVNKAKKIAQNKFYDVLIIDTAGRLHINDEMMHEISELQKNAKPIETLFVVDSMSGQDAVNSAKVFSNTLNLTGIILTKVDSDARGGAALSVKQIVGKPIKFIGMGEKLDALEPFYPDRVASKLLGMGDMLSLIEEIGRKVDKKKADKTIKKIKKGSFNLADMRDQLAQMQSMGGISSLIDKLPMGGQIPEHLKNKVMDDKQSTYMIAIINSMTKKERKYINLLKGSRKKRIANGSGTSIQQVNQTIKQFEKMQKMMKKMRGNKMKTMMQKLQSGVLGDQQGNTKLPF